MKDKLNRFMQGRYGVDNLSRFILGVALFVIVVGSFLRQNAAGGILDTVGFILIIYTYFRILSRNISARYAENQKYLGYTQKIRSQFNREKNMMELGEFCCNAHKTSYIVPRSTSMLPSSA